VGWKRVITELTEHGEGTENRQSLSMTRVITELTEQGEGTENSESLSWSILFDGTDSVGIAGAPCPHHPR
jgi:hypothetical protein